MDDDELAAWYHAADVFVLPSVARREAFGLVQIEAHAAGTPVVSTTLPTGVPFVNLDGVTGLTVPPGDAEALAHALQKLVADDELRARLGSRGARAGAPEFTIERMVDQTLGVYEEAVALHARAGDGTMTRGWFVALSLLLDAVLVNVAFVLAFLVRFGGVLPAFNFQAYLALAPLLTVFYLGGRTSSASTTPSAPRRSGTSPAPSSRPCSWARCSRSPPRSSATSRRSRVPPSPSRCRSPRCFLIGWRLLVMRLFPITWPEQRVLIVGTSALARDLAEALEARRRWGYRVVGLVAAGAEEAARLRRRGTRLRAWARSTTSRR